MPGYERTPFFSAMSIFKQQPPIAAFISTDTVQSIGSGAGTPVTFATPINVDPLALNAWQSVWTPTTPGQFTVTVRGFYLFGGSVGLEAGIYPTWQLFAQVNGNNLTVAELETGINNGRYLSISTMYPAAVGDIFRLVAYQTSGAAKNTQPTGVSPNMWIVKVG